MLRKIGFSLVGITMAFSAAQVSAQGTTNCEARMNEMKPLLSSVTDAKMKQTLTDRWGRAETALKSKDEKACMEHIEFVTRSLQEGKKN